MSGEDAGMLINGATGAAGTSSGRLRLPRWIIVAIVLCVFGGALYVLNYLAVGKELNDALDADPRNAGIQADAHFVYYINPRAIVLDIRNADRASCADMMRVLFQFAANARNSEYTDVELQRRGALRFLLPGTYFRTLGDDCSRGQNPVYLIRTLPENVLSPDGHAAFGTWTGGWLGVLSRQMQDVNTFCVRWWKETLD